MITRIYDHLCAGAGVAGTDAAVAVEILAVFVAGILAYDTTNIIAMSTAIIIRGNITKSQAMVVYPLLHIKLRSHVQNIVYKICPINMNTVPDEILHLAEPTQNVPGDEYIFCKIINTRVITDMTRYTNAGKHKLLIPIKSIMSFRFDYIYI